MLEIHRSGEMYRINVLGWLCWNHQNLVTLVDHTLNPPLSNGCEIQVSWWTSCRLPKLICHERGVGI